MVGSASSVGFWRSACLMHAGRNALTIVCPGCYNLPAKTSKRRRPLGFPLARSPSNTPQSSYHGCQDSSPMIHPSVPWRSRNWWAATGSRGRRGAEFFANPGGMSNPADLTASLLCLAPCPGSLRACLADGWLLAWPEPCRGVTANCQGHLARARRSPRPHSFPAHNHISPLACRTIGQSVPSSETAGQG